MRPEARPNPSRRGGFTLLEMLVVVALVVLMMTILASIFQAATGAMSASRTYQELDDSLRLLDMTIRQDLAGVTARMTPPLDPAQKLGYFEYGENAPADLQGEDTDDYLAFTTKAPEGQFFTGRIWTPNTIKNGASTNSNQGVQPITVTSKFAEVIYFLRHGNLYRRVLLILPERQGQLAVVPQLQVVGAGTGVFAPAIFNGAFVSWMAVNDVSARPSVAPDTGNAVDQTPVPNDLGDLTNREYRYARPRFNNDYYNNSTGAVPRDGIADDGNGDGIPDYWPTLTAAQVQLAYNAPSIATNGFPAGLIMNEDTTTAPGKNGGYSRIAWTTDVFAFPFIYPGMYSLPEASSLDTQNSPPTGWLHALDTALTGGTLPLSTNGGRYINHAPLEFGDSLPIPTTAAQKTTWWGFPTWRETASQVWGDPVFSLYQGSGTQRFGLRTLDPTTAPTPAYITTNFLPPIGSMPPLGFPTFLLGGSSTIPPSYPFPPAIVTPFDSDGTGGPRFVTVQQTPSGNATPNLNPTVVWEDDLIMTGVRSFDVKALDPNASLYNYGNLNSTATPPAFGPAYNVGYYDLGYAASDYVTMVGSTALITGTPLSLFDGNHNPQGFGHEGRMPPNLQDNRLDPQRPLNNLGGFNQVGDNSTGHPRMRRVWDSWSTAYTNAPAVDVNLRGSTFQTAPLDRPIYPSYPPPYPQPLRGIQIQIRVSDAKSERVKILTIRQDFSDKL